MVCCAFPGCHVSNTPKYNGKSLFQFPTRKDEFNTRWRKNLLDCLLKFRELSPNEIKSIMENKQE